jgi:HK97 family phage major capsid protein
MDSDTLNVPKRSAGLTVYYPDQSDAITESTKTFGTEQLVAVKRAVLCAYSSEMGEDSVISIADDLTEEIGMALGLKMDNEMWNGDGVASTYGGVTGLNDSLNASYTVTQGTGNTWGALTLDDFHSAVALLPEKHNPNARWICSRSFFGGVIQNLVYAGGGNTVDTIMGGSNQQLFGYPIEFTDSAPTSSVVATMACVFGNFNNAMLMGDKRAVEIQQSEHYSFNLDEITIRGTSRYDLSVVDDTAYVGIKTGA